MGKRLAAGEVPGPSGVARVTGRAVRFASRARRILAAAAADLAVGTLAGAGAELLERLLFHRDLPLRETGAALAAVAWAGALLTAAASLGLRGVLAIGRRFGRHGCERPAASVRPAAFLATWAALVAAGFAWGTGAHLPAEELGFATRLGVVAAAAAGAVGGLAGLAFASGTLTAGVRSEGFRSGRRRAAWPRAASPLLASGWLAICAAVTAWSWPDRLAGLAASDPAPAAGSVVLIVLDTVRADHLAPYGAAPGSTPTLARLAREGTVFDGVIAPSPWTVPSHASLFTGLPPRTHGCWFGDRRWLDDEFETLAERFAGAGYETVALVSNGYLFLTNLLQGFQIQKPLFGAYERLLAARAMRLAGIGWSRWIDKGATESLDELESWLRHRNPDRPFFLFVNLFEAHEPYTPPWRYREAPPAASPLDLWKAIRDFEPTRWHSQRRREGWQEEAMRRLYAGEVRYQDRRLGELLARLSRHVRIDDVVVAVTSDHGENLGEGGRWGHLFALNDALVHVPLVIRAPGRLPAGRRVAGPFASYDIGPTLLELAGLGPRLGEGRSLLHPERARRPATFSEVYPDYFRLARMRVGIRPGLGEFRWPLAAVRSQGYKLVRWGSGTERLYRLADDPAEERDLAARDPARVRELRALLAEWLRAHPRRRAGSAPPAPLNEDVRRRLEALGYL